MDIFGVLQLVGGLCLFLFGMDTMGNGLTKASGSKLEQVLRNMTSSVPRGVLLGCLVTAVIQSSSATTVMLVGFALWTCRPQTVLTNRSPPASLKIVNDNLTKERERMKKIMFGNSLMLLGIAIMILAGLKVIYVGTLWVSFLLIIVGFVMATIGFFGKDSK